MTRTQHTPPDGTIADGWEDLVGSSTPTAQDRGINPTGTLIDGTTLLTTAAPGA